MRIVDKILLVCLYLLANKSTVLIFGQVDSFIIGGDDAKFKTHPWMASLYFGCFDGCEPEERCSHLQCGGTLIAPNWVLTAAHCFEGTFDNLRWFQVFIGDYDIMENDYNEVQMSVKAIKKHENYTHTMNKVKNDIALIKLNQSVEETPQTKCLRLANSRDTLTSNCHLFGWGVNNQNTTDCPNSRTLKHVNMSQVDLDTCRGYYSDYTIYDTNVCAGGVEGQGACFGDSGGGLYCASNYRPSNYELLGISSWTMTSPCGSQNKPAVFTDATEFRDWINENCENCLDEYNHKCTNPEDLSPIIPSTTTAPPSCEYPVDPSSGHFVCSGSEVGGRVGVGEECTLHCYNDQDGGYQTCQQSGQFNENHLTELNCWNSTSYCPIPVDPLDGHFQCPTNQNGVNNGQMCVLRCYNGQFGGTMQCRSQDYDDTDLVGCKSSNKQCPFPSDPTTGHYQCPTSIPGGMVDDGGVCVLRCYNGLFGNYITCNGWQGTYDETNLELHQCDGFVTIKTTTTTTTTTTAPGCPFPDSPWGNYNCPGFDPSSLVNVGGVCYLICDNNQFGGSIICMSNGLFDESALDEDICHEVTTTTTKTTLSTTRTTTSTTRTTTSTAYCQKTDVKFESGNNIHQMDDINVWPECGRLCQDIEECTHWTWDSNGRTGRTCWIKSGSVGNAHPAPGYISGYSDCP